MSEKPEKKKFASGARGGLVFLVYGLVFTRNSLWSASKLVFGLGIVMARLRTRWGI